MNVYSICMITTIDLYGYNGFTFLTEFACIHIHEDHIQIHFWCKGNIVTNIGISTWSLATH